MKCFISFLVIISAVGDGALVLAKRLWTSQPADPNAIMMTTYTIGNGKQAGMEDLANRTIWIGTDRIFPRAPFGHSRQ